MLQDIVGALEVVVIRIWINMSDDVRSDGYCTACGRILRITVPSTAVIQLVHSSPVAQLFLYFVSDVTCVRI